MPTAALTALNLESISRNAMQFTSAESPSRLETRVSDCQTRLFVRTSHFSIAQLAIEGFIKQSQAIRST